MIIRYWLISATFAAVLADGLAPFSLGASVPSDIPPNAQLFSVTALSEIQRADLLRWPTSEQMKRLRSDKKPSENTFFAPVKTIRRVLQQQWIPTDLPDRMICLKHAVDDSDAVLVRYELDGYNIQIVQTTKNIGITIQSTIKEQSPETAKPSSAEYAREEVGKTIDRFFNESEKIKAVSLGEVTPTAYGFSGKSGFESPIEGSFLHWWGLVSWYTDGQTFGFIVGKPSRATPPAEKRDWF